MAFLSLTTWSLHRNLGPLHMTTWDQENEEQIMKKQEQPETISLLDLPAVVASKGFHSLEVCHFHFPSTTPDYLKQLRDSFQKAGLRFYSLLIDYGDITSQDKKRREADLTFIKKWIDIAALVGAERVRIIAGNSTASDQAALQQSIQTLTQLASYAQERKVRVVTENFHALAATAENCLAIIQAGQGQIGLTADFGNFKAPDKYDQLARILPYAESIHAKAHYDQEGLPDREEFKQCLDLIDFRVYDGPITLVYDGPGDQWAGIKRVQEIVSSYLN